MGKLGLIIKITDQGEHEAHTIHKEETWARHIDDARSLIRELTNFDGTGKSVYFLKFLGKLGYFIGVVKARPAGSGRGGDNTAAWIFVPANVDISGEEEERVIRIVEQAISGEKEIDKRALADEFEKEFKEKQVLFTPIYEIASLREGGSVAGRFYGRGTDYTLKELLGNMVANSEYKKYRAVFLLDKEHGISMSNGNVLNIKSREICRVLPPVCEDLPQECKEFKPYLSDDVVFNKAIEVYAGQELTVTWKRQGFKSVQKTCTVSSEDDGKALSSLSISPMECIRRIPVSVISVCDTRGEKVVGYELHVNGKRVKGEYIEISEALYDGDSEIKVTKHEYEDYSGKVNFAREIQKRVILRPRVYRYEFLIPCYNGKEYIDDYMLYIESEHRIHESPVKGYTLEGERVYEGKGKGNRLKKDIFEPIKYFCYGFLSCIIILLLYTGWKEFDKKYEFSLGWPPVKAKEDVVKFPPADEKDEEKSEDTQSDEKAIAYLSRETIWHKDSLNKYPLLEGLYDDLNEMNLVKIKDEWKNKLISVSQFSRIAFHASRALNMSWNVKQGKHTPTFTEDSIIDINEYIEWLSKDQTPAPSLSSGKITGGETTVSKDSKEETNKSRKKKKGNI